MVLNWTWCQLVGSGHGAGLQNGAGLHLQPTSMRKLISLGWEGIVDYFYFGHVSYDRPIVYSTWTPNHAAHIEKPAKFRNSNTTTWLIRVHSTRHRISVRWSTRNSANLIQVAWLNDLVESSEDSSFNPCKLVNSKVLISRLDGPGQTSPRYEVAQMNVNM